MERGYRPRRPIRADVDRTPANPADDFGKRVPKAWLERGGVIMPMYQAEALWISFGGSWRFGGYPCAIKIATGKINAITGEPLRPNLNLDPQDYVVVPDQPWLDGYAIEKGVIRQFVAMPLGEGYSVEEQLTGTGDIGGLQLIVQPMKAALGKEKAAQPLPGNEFVSDEAVIVLERPQRRAVREGPFWPAKSKGGGRT